MSYSRGPGVLHWHSIDTLGAGVMAPQYAPGTGAMNTADQAVYVPIVVARRVVVKQLWFGSSTTGTGNYDIGLYDAAGVRLLSKGSTAKGTTAEEVVWDCTDTTIGPGLYYLALVSSNATDTFAVFGHSAPVPASYGVYTEVSALPLPATATFAVNHALTNVPVLGMFLDTRVT